MAWSWDTFNNQLSRILDDVVVSNQLHSQGIRIDGLNAALRDLVAYWPVQAKIQDTAGSTEIALPSDCYAVVSVQATDDSENVIVLNSSRVGDISVVDEAGRYYIWDDTIYLDAEYETVDVYYGAYYSEISIGAANIPVPFWTREAVLFMSAAYCLLPQFSNRSKIAQWYDRFDAPPLQNPIIQAADWLVSQFERIMAEHESSR